MLGNSGLLMDLTAIAAVHLAIYVIQRLSNRLYPELKTGQYQGLYFIFLPLGFGLFGGGLSYWATVPFVFGGVWALLAGVRRVLNEDRLSLDE